MSLIKCPECGAEVSSYAKNCLVCGCPGEMFDKLNTNPYIFKKMTMQVGDHIEFGRYPQDKDGKDQTPIEWRVLAVECNKALIISEYALDVKPYNAGSTDITWENCSLREWLNGTFFNEAFNATEQANIQRSKVVSERSRNHKVSGGNSTNDKLFILSVSEAKKYFEDNVAGKCLPTANAIARGAESPSFNKETKGGEYTCSWWLRTPDDEMQGVTNIDYGGGICFDGFHVNDKERCVRPAMWIKL